MRKLRRREAILIGQTLSHYKITSALGAGGMGEVYRATDTNLHRDVAIKVLPPEVAQDPERLARFQREAHLLASLNHPHIAAIYGLEEVDGKPFLALELVEGEDLKERLTRGAIPVQEALEIAAQIAEALEEAHAKGIVHRDLKPANIKLTPDGKVKVLDFGLAKAWGGDPGSGGSSIDLSQSPTLARTGTLAGVILGTAAYMSPEQASGKGVDKRADIWSFGVVLFEMLSGQSLFSGETASEVMASVIKEEPAWDRLPVQGPPALTRLLRRCLRKRPRERLQDIGDARLEIEEIRAGTVVEAEGSSADVEGLRRERRGRRRERWAWALLVGAGLVAFLAHRQLTQAPEPQRAAHFVLDTPSDLSAPDWGAPVASPDGSQVVFAASDSGGQTMLWVRPLDAPSVRPLSGTEGAVSPFWSPDGRSLAFFAQGELRKLSLATGTIEKLCALPQSSSTGGSWSHGGTVLFSSGGSSARIYRVSAAGGEVRPLTSHDASRGETGHWWPQFLPDGRRFLFLVGSSGEAAGLYLASLDHPDERRRIRPGLARALYAPSGHLLFVRDGTLLAQPLDAARAELAGEPVAVSQSVAVWQGVPGLSWGWFSASPSGTLTYLEGEASRDFELTWFDRKGAKLETVGKPGPYGQLALSPDERRVAVQVSEEGPPDLWTIDLARGVATRVTFDPASDGDPVWSPDGRELLFSSNREGPSRLYRKALQGNAPESPLGEGLDGVFSECWSAPAKAMLYVTLAGRAQEEGGQAFGMLPSDGGAKPETILKKDFRIDEPQISPDGRWLAYISQESGPWEVYVEPFRAEGERVRVSTEGGGQPRWRGDGRELFYASPDGRLMAVDVRAQAGQIEVGLPQALFSGVIADPTRDHYAVAANGQRFLVAVPVDKDPRARIHVVTNWTSLLR